MFSVISLVKSNIISYRKQSNSQFYWFDLIFINREKNSINNII
jgi:hypothetical protein